MDWKEHGVKIVHAGELDMNTPQTSGMTRAAAITHARTGAEKLWAGTMVVQPDAKIRGEGPGANAMGRSPGTERRSQGRRFYLCAALRAASGDQRKSKRDLRGGRGEKRARAGGH